MPGIPDSGSTIAETLPSHPWRIFMIVATGVFMSTMDSSMINVALPVIMDSYASPLAQTEWVVLIYLLTISVLLLFWGHLSTHWNKADIYSHGMLIFTLGSLLCAVAPSIYPLIFFRFLQAIGASMMMSMGPALIKSSFPSGQLGRRLGLIGVAVSLGLMTGPIVSGLIIHWLHWRMIFFITVPVGLLCYLAGRTTMKGALPSSTKENENLPPPFDRLGALLWTAAIAITVLVATHATGLGTGSEIGRSPLFLTGIVLGIVTWIFFLAHENRSANPILPLKLFKRRFFLMAILSALLSFAVLFAVLIIIPFFCSRILNLPADRIGYVMMSVPLCVFLISPLAGRIHDRIGAKIVATFGLSCCLISLALLSGLHEDATPFAVSWRLVLLGIGQAMFLSPNSAAALSGVSHKQAGVTSSLLATARNLGMLLGTSFTGLIFTLQFASLTGGLDLKDFTPSQADAFIQAMQGTFHFWTALSFCGVVISWLRDEKG